MKTVALKQGSDEWHAWRRSGIGGSDAPAVLRASPYRTPRSVYFEKIGTPIDLEEQEANEFIFSKGHRTEGLIRQQFQDLVGVEINPVCVAHDSIEFLIASLDGFHPKHGVLEAKLVGQEKLAKARDGIIPPDHWIQMQHQLAATGADIGQWFGHDGESAGVLVSVTADAEQTKLILEEEAKFWDLVKSKTVPPLTEMDYLVPDDQKLLEELFEAKVQMDNSKAYFELAKERALSAHKHVKIAGGGIKIVRMEKRGSIDYKKLPEVQRLSDSYLDQFRGASSSQWNVTIDKVKKGKKS